MRSPIRIIAAAVASGFLLAGQALAQTPPPPVDSANTATPAMWRVADADSEFILIGTFHILPPALQWRTDAFNAAFEKADRLYFEVDADTPDARTKTVGIMMTEGFNPNGGKLTSMLDPQDAAKLREVSAELGLPIAGIDPMRPWQAFLTLTVQFIIKQGFDPGAGVDSVLIADAKARKKDIHYFETLEQQLGFFTGLSPETEKSLLVITLRDWDNQKASFDNLFNAWRTGDVGYIDKEMNGQMRELAPEVYETLIVERNKAWAAELAGELRNGSGNVLIAVGAGHLVGDDSVPALLKAQGFEVTRYGETAGAANDNAPAGADGIGEIIKTVGEE